MDVVVVPRFHATCMQSPELNNIGSGSSCYWVSIKLMDSSLYSECMQSITCNK